jgi:ABC-2 type transport system ATP-binding protein
MQIGEQMLYLAQLKGLPKNEATQRIKAWFTKMEMETWWNKKVEDLSKGMQQKVQFVATVVHDPELIILDEPFSGFDPVNAEIIRDEILELNRNGKTIIFSTHRMESVEELCDSIALINRSHKILEGKVKDIKNSYRSNTYKVDFKGQDLNVSDPVFRILKQDQHDDLSSVTLQLNEGRTSAELLSQLIGRVEISGFNEVIPSMNDIFISQVKNLNQN